MMLEHVLKIPCPACLAAIEGQIAAAGSGPLDVDWFCVHHAVGLNARVEGGAPRSWNLYSCASQESFMKTLAYQAGGRAGIEAHLAAEAAIRKAGGEPSH